MKNLIQIVILFTSLSLSACSAPIHNAKSESFKVFGNCEMCKKTIETAAFKKGGAKAEWNENTKIVSLTFDSTKTNSDDILKRIAYAGYDNVNYLAPDDAYAKLPECCQYDRAKKETVKAITQNTAMPEPGENAVYTCPMHPEVKSDKLGKCPKCGMALVKKKKTEEADIAKNDAPPAKEETKNAGNPLSAVYAAYFNIKDALVKDDGITSAAKAKELLKAIEAAPMSAMNTEQHNVWMKVLEDLKFDASHISDTKEVDHQRGHFATLSKNMHQVMKVIKPDYTVYYDHCPMYNDNKGANWLSTESAIKNPFYGSQMLTCGSVKETIK